MCSFRQWVARHESFQTQSPEKLACFSTTFWWLCLFFSSSSVLTAVAFEVISWFSASSSHSSGCTRSSLSDVLYKCRPKQTDWISKAVKYMRDMLLRYCRLSSASPLCVFTLISVYCSLFVSLWQQPHACLLINSISAQQHDQKHIAHFPMCIHTHTLFIQLSHSASNQPESFLTHL